VNPLRENDFRVAVAVKVAHSDASVVPPGDDVFSHPLSVVEAVNARACEYFRVAVAVDVDHVDTLHARVVVNDVAMVVGPR